MNRLRVRRSMRERNDTTAVVLGRVWVLDANRVDTALLPVHSIARENGKCVARTDRLDDVSHPGGERFGVHA